MKRLFLPLLLLLASTPTLRAERAPSSDDLAFFEKKVRPLLFARCQDCHSLRTKKQRGGLLLDSRAAILKGGDHGPALVPGQPARSRLIAAVRQAGPEKPMP